MGDFVTLFFPLHLSLLKVSPSRFSRDGHRRSLVPDFFPNSEIPQKPSLLLFLEHPPTFVWTAIPFLFPSVADLGKSPLSPVFSSEPPCSPCFTHRLTLPVGEPAVLDTRFFPFSRPRDAPLVPLLLFPLGAPQRIERNTFPVGLEANYSPPPCLCPCISYFPKPFVFFFLILSPLL